MTARYVLGIDLGTTNSVIAYTPLDVEQPAVQLLPIPQLVAAGTVESLGSLASFLYLAREHEIGQGVFDLSWAAGRDFAVGELARRQSAEVAERTVGAAKSWLCHARVDRRGEILPWNAPAGVPKISPVTATRRYLEHLIATWEQAFPDVPLADQFIVLTVPASFDAAARDLTREAALAAGLPGSLLLLEEPQAAVYAWLDSLGNRWRRALKLDDMLLVCDVGGGTSDFTLVKVAEEKGELILQREAVGNHLLVGGDNMDLALAYQAAETFGNKGVKLDPWQSVSLWHACRAAKETLLSADGPNAHTISVLGRGTKLIGGTVSIEMKRKQALEVLVEGFFPPCEIGERPVRRRASGFQDIGLPFEQDTAVTRHLAAFLVDHGAGQGGGGSADPRAAQRWCLQGQGAVGPAVGRLGPVGRRRETQISGRPAGPGQRGCSRSGVLWLGQRTRRRANPRRHGAGLLRRHRDRRIGHPRRSAAVAGTVRRAAGYGGRRPGRCAVAGDRFGRWRTGPFPFLQFLDAQTGQGRGGAAFLDRRRTRRNRFDGSHPGRGRSDRGTVRAGQVPVPRHRVRHVRTVVCQHQEQEEMEAGVQRPRRGLTR